MRLIVDLESNTLLTPALDYSTMPYRFVPEFKVWCIVVRNVDTNAVVKLRPDDVTKENLSKALKGCTELIGHNIIGFDLPVLKLYGLLDYRIGYPGEPSTLNGEIVEITDTLVWSKLLNPDRFGGHSLDAWGERLGNKKIKFNQWDRFSEEMLTYCVQDTSVNVNVLDRLEWERGEHNWSRAYSVETKLIDLTLRQEVFGFHFNEELARKNIAELSEMMQEIAVKVDPILPPKKMTKGAMGGYTPPKLRFKQDGTVASVFQKWLDRMDAFLVEGNSAILFEGKHYPVDTTEPLKTHMPATIEDIDTVKGYLLDMGWEPTEVKERDLVKKADKTIRNYDEIVEAIDRYVEQTIGGVFEKLRTEMLGVEPEDLRKFLITKINDSKPIYVPSSPKLAVGLEKEICPSLIELGEKAEFVKDVVHYYTYRHRKNSIAGGAMDEDGEPVTGFLSCVREDGRIPTPADTLGANTGRYKHKIVCNIPRVTSLYGEPMRNQFGPGAGLWELGYDFASLEARIMGHYVKPYTNGDDLAAALLAVKPNDIHSINAKKLGIPRDQAKNFSYAAIYGAQPKKLAKMLNITEAEARQLFEEYWDAVPALKELKDKVEYAWEKSGKRTIPGLDGRLLNTRSKHSLVNVLFQSGGAIAAKWSAVRFAQALEREGILGDPFIHTKEEPKVWWMIHMHDEQQTAVHPSLLNVKVYATEEEAVAAKVEGCSAIGHGSKGPYLAFKTKPIECIAEGIETATKELKLRVELGFEYIAGKSWGQCH